MLECPGSWSGTVEQVRMPKAAEGRDAAWTDLVLETSTVAENEGMHVHALQAIAPR
jgi:hypothetical protein